jgi:hypothetical protein
MPAHTESPSITGVARTSPFVSTDATTRFVRGVDVDELRRLVVHDPDVPFVGGGALQPAAPAAAHEIARGARDVDARDHVVRVRVDPVDPSGAVHDPHRVRCDREVLGHVDPLSEVPCSWIVAVVMSATERRGGSVRPQRRS